MPISITGTGTITGISAGGLPDDCITTAEIAGSAVTTAKLSQPMTLATAQNATGTSVDFTGIPSWAKKITVMLNGVSTNGTSVVMLQIGSGSIDSSGYLGAAGGFKVSGSTINMSSGFITSDVSVATYVRHGQLILNYFGNNIWSQTTNIGLSDDSIIQRGSGTKTLSGTLDRIRITTVNGTDAFDAGSINIMYEG